MLSGETAAGKYPVEAVKVMASIAKRIEQTLDYDRMLKEKGSKNVTVTDAISHATCTTAVDLNASAIITSTSSGYTAKMVSKFRPQAPIIAATSNEAVMRRLALTWGVCPIKSALAGNTDEVIEKSIEASIEKAPIIAATSNEAVMRRLALTWGVCPIKSALAGNTDEVIEKSIEASIENGYVKNGELVVITAGVPVGVSGTTNLIKVHVISEVLGNGVGIGNGTVEGYVKNGELVVITAGVPVGVSGTTNLIKVHVISEVLGNGVGIGNGTVEGRVRVANENGEIKDFKKGDIIVAKTTDKDMNGYIEDAAAIVTEFGGMTSHAAIVGLNLNTPVVVSVANITNTVKDGDIVTVDAKAGIIYKGSSRVL